MTDEDDRPELDPIYDPQFVSAILSIYVQEIIEKCYGQSNETLLQNIELIKEAIEWVAKVYDIKVIGDSSKHSEPYENACIVPARRGKPLVDKELAEYKKEFMRDAMDTSGSSLTNFFSARSNENVMFTACRYGILPLIKYLVNEHNFGVNDNCFVKITRVSEQRWTPLDVCVRNHQSKCIRWLLNSEEHREIANITDYIKREVEGGYWTGDEEKDNAIQQEMKQLLGL